MSTKYVSGRVKELKVGITNYSESKESLSVIGIVSATKYFGDGSDLTGTQTPGIDTTGSSTFNQLFVSGISTFNDDVKFIGANTNAIWDKSGSNFTLYDNTRLEFGSNTDFEIWHGGSHTFMKNSGGDLRIRGDKILLKREDGSETYLEANVNNEVKLFFNGVEKFETTGAGVTVFGNTETQTLKVSGVSTYQGDLDIESSVLITGITTIGGLVDINAGGQANTFKVEDLTDNRVVIAGTGGELEDDANLTFNGTQFNVGSGITMYQATGIVSATKFYGDGSSLTGIDASALKDSGGTIRVQANTSGAVVTGVLTATSFSGNGAGLTNLEIPGISTSGTSNFTNLNVSGIITASSIDAAIAEWVLGSNGSSDYTFTGPGLTGAENDPTIYLKRGQKYNFKNSMGAHPFQIRTAINGSAYNDGIVNNGVSNGTLTWDVQFDAPDILYYQCTAHAGMVGKIYIGNSGDTATFDGDITANGNIAGDGSTNITGINEITAAGNITANGNIAGDGSTNITGIAGVTATTLTGTLQTAAQPNVTSLGTITNLVASSAKVSDLTNGRVVYAGASGELQDSANLTFNGSTLTAGAFAGDGSQLTNLPGIDTAGGSTFNDVFSSGINTLGKGASGRTFLYDADSLKFQTTGIGVSVSSGTAKTAYIEGPEEIWIDPHPAGVGTTSGVVRIRGDLYVDGKEVIIDVEKLELGDFQIGIASTAGTNAQLDGGGIGIGSVSIRKTITWNNATSALMCSENWNLGSGKHYEIAGTDVLTATTLGSGVVNSSLTSLGTIASLTASTAKVSDLTNTRVVYAGASGELQDSASLTFDGTTLTASAFAGNGAALTNVAITGISTTSNSDFNDINVSGNLNVTGISTFTGNITANGNIAGDGSTNITGIGEISIASKIVHTGDTDTEVSFGSDAIALVTGGTTRLSATNAAVVISGTCQALDFNSTSDIRLKDNIQVIEDPLAKLVQIEGVSFNWKENNKPALGVIADQVQEILPELVTDGDPKTVNYNGLIGLLIEAVKEQQIQINELKSKLP